MEGGDTTQNTITWPDPDPKSLPTEPTALRVGQRVSDVDGVYYNELCALNIAFTTQALIGRRVFQGVRAPEHIVNEIPQIPTTTATSTRHTYGSYINVFLLLRLLAHLSKLILISFGTSASAQYTIAVSNFLQHLVFRKLSYQ